MVPGELFGQLEATVVVDAGHSPDHAGPHEVGHVAIGAALGQLGIRRQDLGDRERPSGFGQRGD
jgi:hypothetical protein